MLDEVEHSGFDAEQVDALVDQLLGAPVPRPIRWADLAEPAAEAAWTELAGWSRWLATRYQMDGRELPPCWWRHGALVEELTALHGAWLVAYDEGQTAAAMADWHRVLHETRLRMREWASRTGCSTHDHRDGTTPAWASGDFAAWLADMKAGTRSGTAARTSPRP